MLNDIEGRIDELPGGDEGSDDAPFSPVRTKEVGIIRGLSKETYLLLRLIKPFTYHDHFVEFLYISPIYIGDSLEAIRNTSCIVGNGWIIPGDSLKLDNGLEAHDGEYGAMVKCVPMTE